MGGCFMPIKLNHVFHVYSQKTPFQFEALQDVSLVIEEKSFTAIIGHTGSGKSTLIQHLNALLLPTSGEVEVNGIVIRANQLPKEVKKIRQYAGVVFQFPEAQLFEERVIDDVMFGPLNFGKTKLEAKEAAMVALHQVGLDASFDERSPFELSGGERRRVAIAGILAMQPNVLILDEPTAGLDPEGATKMMELFTQLHQQGMTIILVTHDMELVLKFANQVIVMEQGKVITQSSPQEFFYQQNHQESFMHPPLVQLIKKLRKRGKKISSNQEKSLEAFIAGWKG
ncbi:MAG: energy-coupling factor transporter ATPase [Bacilli bacterium]